MTAEQEARDEAVQRRPRTLADLPLVLDLLAEDLEDMRANGYGVGTQMVGRARAVAAEAHRHIDAAARDAETIAGLRAWKENARCTLDADKAALGAIGRERNTWARQMADLHDERDTAVSAHDEMRSTLGEVATERDVAQVNADAAEARVRAVEGRVGALIRAWEDEDPQAWDVHTTGVGAAEAARYAILADLRAALATHEPRCSRCDFDCIESGCSTPDTPEPTVQAWPQEDS